MHTTYIPTCIIMQIKATEVEFWSNDPETLQQMELEGFYPPRFTLKVSRKHAYKTTYATIHFKGTTNELKAELMLQPGMRLHGASVLPA